jgi:putative transposase
MIDSTHVNIFAVVDDFTRECLALVADASLPGLRVVHELAVRGRPCASQSLSGDFRPDCRVF